jgi:hypothetical protein
MSTVPPTGNTTQQSGNCPDWHDRVIIESTPCDDLEDRLFEAYQFLIGISRQNKAIKCTEQQCTQELARTSSGITSV